MHYRLKIGVVLFCMCGEYFIFPSREAIGLFQMIISVSSELVSVLSSDKEIDLQALSEETIKKLTRLKATGFVEEY